MEQINRHLAAQLTKNQSVILWGAGQLAMKLLALPALAHTPVRALVDNNPILRGKTLGAHRILVASNRSARSRTQGIAGTRDPIIIATLLHAEENQFPDSKPRTRQIQFLRCFHIASWRPAD